MTAQPLLLLCFSHNYRQLYIGGFSIATRVLDTQPGIISTVSAIGGSRAQAVDSKGAIFTPSRLGLLTWDVGLLTTGNTDAGNSEICFNWFHDNLSEGLARGIFLSTGTHNMLVHHNVVWHCWEGGFHGDVLTGIEGIDESDFAKANHNLSNQIFPHPPASACSARIEPSHSAYPAA